MPARRRACSPHEPLDATGGADAREARLELLPREVGEGRDPVPRRGVQRLVRRGAGQVGREHAQPPRVLLGPGVPPPVPPHERRELRFREQPGPGSGAAVGDLPDEAPVVAGRAGELQEQDEGGDKLGRHGGTRFLGGAFLSRQ